MTAMNQIKLGHQKSAKDPVAEKPAALGAFLSTTARNTIKKPKQDKNEEEVTTLNNDSILPLDVSHKIACMLKPGPPFYSTISSADLIEHLSTSAIMNGETKQSHDEKKWYKPFANAGKNKAEESSGKEQILEKLGSVWSNLDSLPSGANAFEINKTDPSNTLEKDEEKDDGLWSAIMFSCDLEGESVELAKSCVVPNNILKEHRFYRGNPQVLFSEIGAGEKYPWDDWSKKEEANDAAATSAMTRFIAPTLDMWSWPSWMSWGKKEDGENETTQPSKPEEPSNEGVKRVWVPSKDKVSVHARWWGFTVYVPEPVMAELGKESQKSEDIANIVYKVLSGILKFAASEPLPAPLGQALKILQSLAPTVSYLSTFIGWSWKELKSCDKGQGIELSATWILPIALIPSQWSAPVAPAAAGEDEKKTEQQTQGPNDKPASDEAKKEEEQGEQKKPDEKKADQEKKPEEKKTEDETKAEEKKAEDKKAEEKKPEEKKAEDKKAEEKKPEEKKVDEKKAEDKKAEEKKVDEKKAEDKKAEEKKAEDKKAEDKKAEEKKAEEKKPEDKKPEEKKADERKAEDKKAEEKKAVEKKPEEKKPEEKKPDEQPAVAFEDAKPKKTEQAKRNGNTLEQSKASDKKPEQSTSDAKKPEQVKSEKEPEQAKTEKKKPEQAKNEAKKPEQAKTEKKPEQAKSDEHKETEATEINLKTNLQEQPAEPKQIAQQQKPEQKKSEDGKKVEGQVKTANSSYKENKVAEGSKTDATEPKTSPAADAKTSANIQEEKPTKGGMVRRMLSTKGNKH